MFGYPAYYIHRKLFACVYGEGVGVKLPEDVATPSFERRTCRPVSTNGKAKDARVGPDQSCVIGRLPARSSDLPLCHRVRRRHQKEIGPFYLRTGQGEFLYSN